MGNTRLTRICSVCGTQKPLSAFLEISSDRGTTYGTICATCRGAGLGKPGVKDTDDASTSRTHFNIDAKARYQIELEQNRLAKAAKESHLDELKKRENITEDKTERSEVLKKAEKDFRERRLGTTLTHDFLKTAASKEAAVVATRVAQADSIFSEKKRHGEVTQRNMEQGNREEARKSATDLGEGSFIDTAHTYEERFQGSEVNKALRTRLGEGSAFMRNQSQRTRAANLFNVASKETGPRTDPTVDYVKEHLTPRSPGAKK